jgi:predicted Fe-S protein YdhL (DUF1289 family)
MNAKLETSLSGSERLSSVLGESSLSGSPCNGGVCSTTLGDIRCKTCGRHEDEIRQWHQLPEIKRKIINIKNAAEGYKIRQVSSQEDRWRELQKLKTIDNLTVGDVIKRITQVATHQSEMYPQDHKCIALLNKIIKSKHKFNDISVQSIMSENDYAEIKNKFE